MVRGIAAAVVAAVLLVLTGCLTPLTSQQVLTPVPVPASPVVGVYEPGAPASWSGIANFIGRTGVKPGIVVYYSSWNEPFAASFAQTARSHDAYVLVQLEPNNVSLSSIASGGSDGYLRSFAGAVVAFAHPVILSFGHEMNGTWYSWGDGHVPPSTFVAAWRHVVEVFRDSGAANVTWLWTVNSIEGASSALSQWWPGSAWVTWVGMSGYFYQSSDTFGSVFGSTIADIRGFSSAPLIVAETAVGTTANRESQIDGLFAGVQANGLPAVVWFDVAQSAGLYHQDWRLEDDSSALAAFSAAVAKHIGAGAHA